MGRPRQLPRPEEAASSATPGARRVSVRAAGAPSGSPHTTQAATDLAMLLRSRQFCLSGEGALLSRVASNLQTFGGAIADEAPAWIGTGVAPEGSVAVALGDRAGALGPHSFGFLNNVDGVAPLAAPLTERPRRGAVAWVVPRRDALPEVAPLLCGRDLGASWLISVGDGDPVEVMRFLARDPATRAILLAVGRGVRPQTLLPVLAEKPTVLLELPSVSGRDSALLRAVARRGGAVVTGDLEEWLAHAALLDALGDGAAALTQTVASRRARAAVVVVGGGSDFVAAEVQRMRGAVPILMRTVDPVDGAAGDADGGLRQTLQRAARDAGTVLLCGSPSLFSDHADALAGAGSLLRVDLNQPERLRALLRALSMAPRPMAFSDDKPLSVRTERERVQGVLAGLPPPLYIGGAVVREEVLGDHDLKRLLAAYGVRVTRQAPANTATAVLRIGAKLDFPVELLPCAAPHSDVSTLIAVESRERVICQSQADLKRQAALMLARHAHVLLREVVAPGPSVRLSVASERGVGNVLRLGGDEAALLPLGRAEAAALAEQVCRAHGVDGATELAQLCGQIAACLGEHALTLDLDVRLGSGPVVMHAAGVLSRTDVSAATGRRRA